MQLPSQFIMAAIDFKSIETGGRTQTNGGNILRGSTTSHRYGFKIQTPRLNVYNETPLLRAFLDEVGYNGTFTVSIPHLSASKGNASGSPRVKSAVPAGSKKIRVANTNPGTANFSLPGDMLSFSGHSKVYMSASGRTYNSNSSGEFDLYLTKPLLRPLAANESISFSPVFTVIPDSDQWQEEFDASKGPYAELELKVEEFY